MLNSQLRPFPPHSLFYFQTRPELSFCLTDHVNETNFPGCAIDTLLWNLIQSVLRAWATNLLLCSCGAVNPSLNLKSAFAAIHISCTLLFWKLCKQKQKDWFLTFTHSRTFILRNLLMHSEFALFHIIGCDKNSSFLHFSINQKFIWYLISKLSNPSHDSCPKHFEDDLWLP